MEGGSEMGGGKPRNEERGGLWGSAQSSAINQGTYKTC